MPADLGRFKETLVYSRRATVPELLEDLAAIRAFDLEHEKAQRFWGQFGCLGAVLAGVSLVAVVATLESSRMPALFIVPILLLAGAITAGVTWSRHRKQNLENRRYELLERILGFLRRDSRPDGAIHVDLDLRPANDPKKHLRDGKVGPWKVKYYADRWLRVSGRLLDGTTYHLSAMDKRQDRHKTYRSRSGKMKSKSKTKSATQLTLSLKVKTRRFPGLAGRAADAKGAVQLPPWASLKAVRVAAPAGSDKSSLMLSSVTTAPWTAPEPGSKPPPQDAVRWFAMSFLSLYQVLGSARAQKQA